MRKLGIVAIAATVVACGGGANDSTCSPDTDFACAFQTTYPGGFGGSPGGSGGSGGTGGMPGGSGGMDPGGSGGVIIGDDTRCTNGLGGSRKDAVCARWKCTLETAKEGSWNLGDVTSCMPGDNPDGRLDGTLTVNTYRFLAGLDPVTIDPEKAKYGQACALIMHANRTLTHTPGGDMTCYTQDGYTGASNSNLATAPSVHAVHLYMFDGGANNQDTLGHRRWIISPSLSSNSFSMGSTSEYSCMWVVHGGTSDDGHPYVAWPPNGPVPVEAITGLARLGTGSLDSIGWSIQSNSIPLSASNEVQVSENGVAKSVKVYDLRGGYGSRYAIQFKPDGWSTRAGARYRVQVVGTTIDYTVEPVDCN